MKCPISEPKLSSWEYLCGTDKWCVKYEVCVSIGVPRIIWWSGPYKGAASDASIANVSGIKEKMKIGEKALADKIYRFDEDNFVCPVTGHRYALTEGQKEYNFLIYSARQTVERLIKRIRNGKFSKSIWRYDIDFHKLCFHAQSKITNLCFLFEPLG